MRFARTSPARARICRCSPAVGWLTPSLWAINRAQTPSLTRSPSTCGGKCARGSLSQPRIWSRRSLARALTTSIESMQKISLSTNQRQAWYADRNGWPPSHRRFGNFPEAHRINSMSEPTYAGHPIVGTWRLISFTEQNLDTGAASYPFGEEAKALVIYEINGYFATIFTRSD